MLFVRALYWHFIGPWLTRVQLNGSAMPDAFDLRALLDTVIVVSIIAIAAVGFVAGMKELILDLRKLRRAKV